MVYHIDVVILNIDTGYGFMIWEMTVSIRSSPISIWDILFVTLQPGPPYRDAGEVSPLIDDGRPSLVLI